MLALRTRTPFHHTGSVSCCGLNLFRQAEWVSSSHLQRVMPWGALEVGDTVRTRASHIIGGEKKTIIQWVDKESQGVLPSESPRWSAYRLLILSGGPGLAQVQAQPTGEENYYEGTIVRIHVEGGNLLYDVAYADCDEMDEKVTIGMPASVTCACS